MELKNIIETFVSTLSQDNSLKDIMVTPEWPVGREPDSYPAITVASRGYRRGSAGMGGLLFAAGSPGATGSKVDTDIHIRIMTPADCGGLYMEDVLDKIITILRGSSLAEFIASISAGNMTYDPSKEVLQQALTVNFLAVGEGL